MEAPKEFSIGSANFWNYVNKNKNSKSFTFLKDSNVHYVVFDDSVRMEPFVRTEEIMFDVHATLAAKNNGYLAVINAQFYDLTPSGYIDYSIGNDAVAAEDIKVEGYTVFGKKIIAGRPAPQNFYIANYTQEVIKYYFGFGQAPSIADAAIGGAGPLIIKGLPYGSVNLYKTGQPKGKLHGQPSKDNTKNLTQRSNLTYDAFTKHKSTPRTGFTILAHHSKQKKLAIFVKPDQTSNTSLEQIRQKLIGCGFDNAIFLDGSNSSMLMVDGSFYAKQAASKNKTNVVGIGFKYK